MAENAKNAINKSQLPTNYQALKVSGPGAISFQSDESDSDE